MKIVLFCFSIITILFFLSGCSSSKETYNRGGNKTVPSESGFIRVLLDEQPQSYKFVNKEPLYLKNGNEYLALINPGNTFAVRNSGSEVEVNIKGKNFSGKDIQLVSENPGDAVDYKGNSYYGTINIIPDGNEIRIINFVPVEQYLKGVIPREMPTGKGNEYFEALKAFTICARTYTVSKINENKKLYDVFADTRDQVYGGKGIEKDIINRVVDETRGMILTYNDKPAMTFYHSTCGGYTEDASDVFPKVDVPYLKGVKDGDGPYCTISPKYTWTEIYPEETFIRRLLSAGYLQNTDYSINAININNTFRSGRINELEIDLSDKFNNIKTLNLYGNNIRYVIRSSDNKSILESSNFTIKRGSRGEIILNGKGYGHGVGLCQWGALEQSVEGKSYEDILSFYYPGTKIERNNDR